MLEKWRCHGCEKGWLMLEEDAQSVQSVGCPFCSNRNSVEAVTGQNPNEDLKSYLGCLWPGYNEFDKIAYKLRSGQISQEDANKRFYALFNRGR